MCHKRSDEFPKVRSGMTGRLLINGILSAYKQQSDRPMCMMSASISPRRRFNNYYCIYYIFIITIAERGTYVVAHQLASQQLTATRTLTVPATTDAQAHTVHDTVHDTVRYMSHDTVIPNMHLIRVFDGGYKHIRVGRGRISTFMLDGLYS